MLSAELITRSMTEHFECEIRTVSLPEPDGALPLKAICPLNFYPLPKENMNHEQLWITDTEGLDYFLENIAITESHFSGVILCAGWKKMLEEQCRRLYIPVIFVSESSGVADLWASAESMFKREQLWRESVYQCYAARKLKGILEASVEVFGTSLSLVNSYYKWVELAGPAPDMYNNELNQMPMDVISALMKNNSRINSMHGAFVAPDPYAIFVNECLCDNVFVKNAYWGRIVAYHEKRPIHFLESDKTRMNLLGNLVELLMNDSGRG